MLAIASLAAAFVALAAVSAGAGPLDEMKDQAQGAAIGPGADAAKTAAPGDAAAPAVPGGMMDTVGGAAKVGANTAADELGKGAGVKQAGTKGGTAALGAAMKGDAPAAAPGAAGAPGGAAAPGAAPAAGGAPVE